MVLRNTSYFEELENQLLNQLKNYTVTAPNLDQTPHRFSLFAPEDWHVWEKERI